MPAERGRPRPFTRARPSAPTKRTTMADRLTPAAERACFARRQPMRAASRRTPGDCTICTATSGNGARTGTASIPKATSPTRPARPAETAAFLAAVAGSTSLPSAARPTAPRSSPRVGTSTRVSRRPRRGVNTCAGLIRSVLRGRPGRRSRPRCSLRKSARSPIPA